jgi:hypothetical protein
VRVTQVIEKYKSKKNRLHIIDSDHVPCLININTNILKSHIFGFENYWLEHDQFMEVVAHGWNIPVQQLDAAKF